MPREPPVTGAVLPCNILSMVILSARFYRAARLSCWSMELLEGGEPPGPFPAKLVGKVGLLEVNFPIGAGY
jgi:hypothetical protein